MLKTQNFSDLGQIILFQRAEVLFSFSEDHQSFQFRFFCIFEQNPTVFIEFCSTLRFCTNELFKSWDFHPKRLMTRYYTVVF